MGYWSRPDTDVKARLLLHFMGTPLRREHAIELLYELLGDNELFDLFHLLGPESDVRCLVLFYLESLMSQPEENRSLWDPQAIQLCNKIINQFYGLKTAS